MSRVREGAVFMCQQPDGSQELETLSRSPSWVTGPGRGHPTLLSWVQQLGLKLVFLWDAAIVGDSLTPLMAFFFFF